MRQRIDVIVSDLKIIHEQVTHFLRHGWIDRHLYYRTKFAFADVLLHGLEQVIGFEFLNFDIGIAHDAEGMGCDNFQTGKQPLKICSNDLVQPDEIMMMRNGPIFSGAAR